MGEVESAHVDDADQTRRRLPPSSGTATAPEAIVLGTRLGGGLTPPALMTGLGSESGSPVRSRRFHSRARG